MKFCKSLYISCKCVGLLLLASDVYAEKQPENIEEIRKRFERNIQSIASSSQNDEISQQARELTKTNQEIERLKKKKEYHEKQAQWHLQRAIASQRVTDDDVLQIAREEGFSPMEFLQMVNKNNPRVKKWIYKAKLRAFNRMKERMKK